MRIGVGQVRVVAGDIDGNLERTLVAIDGAATGGAELLVLPEVCVTGFVLDSERMAAIAEPADWSGPALSAWRRAARASGIAIVAGFAELDGTHVYNSAVAIDRSGDVRGVYRKLHLFAGEREVITPGNRGLPVLDLDGCRVGMLICYDLRFPETTRLMALQDADVVAVPAAWVAGFDAPVDEHAPSIGQVDNAKVQANLNQVVVACASAVGQAPIGLAGADERPFLGRSVVIDSFGKVRTGPGSPVEPTVLVTEVDLGEVRSSRRRAGGLSPREERRTDVYSIALTADAEEQTGDALLERIERERGYVLDLHRTLARWDPAFLAAYDGLLQAAFLRSRTLDRRTKELIYVGVLTALGTDDSHLRAHMAVALDHGATERELLEVLEQVLPPAGVPRFLAGLHVFEELCTGSDDRTDP